MSLKTIEVRFFSGPVTVETSQFGSPQIFEINQGPRGQAGADGAAGPNTVTSATTTDFATGQVLYANGTNVGSLSRSGIDTRTTFPNDDVTAATLNGTPNTLVRRDASGGTEFGSTVVISTINSTAIEIYSGSTAIYAEGAGDGITGLSSSAETTRHGGAFSANAGTGLKATTFSGTYHASFGDTGNNRSAIERVRGWFVWFYSTFVGRLKTADITANRDWTLPDASGTIALTSDIPTLGANVATFLATPSSANLAAAVTDEVGTGSLVFQSFVGDMGRLGNTADVSITGATTLTASAFGAMHVCTGTAADYTVTLPSPSGNAGRMIGFRMSNALTRFVTLSTPTGLIDGVSTRIMWAQETAVLYCDGTNWTKIGGRSRPMIYAGENGAGVSVLNVTNVPISMATVLQNNTGLMNDTVSSVGVCRIRRAGNYALTAFVSLTRAGSFAGFEAYSMLFLNSISALASSPSMAAVVPTSINPVPETFAHIIFAQSRVLAANDYLALATYQTTGGTMTTRTPSVVRPHMTITEIPNW